MINTYYESILVLRGIDDTESMFIKVSRVYGIDVSHVEILGDDDQRRVQIITKL